MKIEVYSIKSFSGNALKSKLEKALFEQNLPYKVTEVNNVDEFIKAGLTSVPAVKVGNQVIEHSDEIPYDTTVQKALDLIMNGCDKYILVPVDFTPESHHALRYARMMASFTDKCVTAMYVHEPLFDPITGSAFDLDLIENDRKMLDEMVVGISWDQYRVNECVPIHKKFEVGNITSNLIATAKEDKYDLIILSTKGEDSILKRLFGSVSTSVGMLGTKPVIVLPAEAPLKFPGKMVVGMTEELFQGATLDYILDFACDHKIFVDFVYATNDQENFKKLKNNLYERLVLHRTELVGFNIRSVAFVADKVHEALAGYSMTVKADLLVLVTKHRNFIEGLTHKSVSKKALLHPLIPLMILHNA